MAEENEVAQRVLKIVKSRGPVIPTGVSKELGITSILASAILSELVSKSQLKISSIKMGGTPFYYSEGQEEKLQNYTRYLHDKEKLAYELLKKSLVLRDRALEPVARVSLRQIKDFAIPLNVRNEGDVELFWKWYLISNEESEPLIKKILGVPKPAKEGGHDSGGAEKRKEKRQKEIADRSPLPKPEKPKKKQADSEKPSLKSAPKKSSEDFLKKVADYFSEKGIEVVEEFSDKKKKEADFVIKIPSPVGHIRYFCKAKDKKSCSDGDLSTAYVQGQSKKLPVLFLTTGKLTKSAKEMLDEEFNNMRVKSV